MTSPTRSGSTGNPKYTVLRERVTWTRYDVSGGETTSDEIGYVIYENGTPVHFTYRCRDAYRWIEAQS